MYYICERVGERFPVICQYISCIPQISSIGICAEGWRKHGKAYHIYHRVLFFFMSMDMFLLLDVQQE